MRTLTLAISGSGGAGAIFTGELVLQLVAGNGGYGMLKKTFSPHIRGGESAAILCLGSAPVSTIPARIDLLVALEAGVRFVAAYPITPASNLLEWLAPPPHCAGGAIDCRLPLYHRLGGAPGDPAASAGDRAQ